MRPPRCLLVIVLIAALTAGCDTVRWLPDSSGIIFPEKDGTRLVRYDFSTKKRAVLLSDEKIKSIWPGISADGKKFTVGQMTDSAKRGSKDRTMKLRIIVYSMDGKELSRGKVHERKDQLDKEAERTEENVEYVFLDWSGPADKLLLLWGPVFGIYDLKKDTIQELEAGPLPVFASPVRPDGKGFVAMVDEKEPHLALFDWEGKGKKLIDLSKLKDKEDDRRVLTTWAKSRCRFMSATRTITIDTDKGTVQTELLAVKPQRREEKFKWVHAFPGGEAFLCRVEKEPSDHWLELHQPGKKRVTTVTKPSEYRINDMQLFPSPDGKFLALSGEDDKGRKRILIIDDAGSIRHVIPIED